MRIGNLLAIQPGGPEALQAFLAASEELKKAHQQANEIRRLDQDAAHQEKALLDADVADILGPANKPPSRYTGRSPVREVYRCALEQIGSSIPILTGEASQRLIELELKTSEAFDRLGTSHARSVHQALGEAVALGGGSLVVQESPLTTTIKQWGSRFFWAASEQREQLRSVDQQPASLRASLVTNLYNQFVQRWESLVAEFELVFAKRESVGAGQLDAPTEQEMTNERV